MATTDEKVTVEENEKIPKVFSFKFLDENNTILPNTATKYVNLPKDSKYVDGTIIKHKEQLGRSLRCKVKFNKKGSFKFKIELKPKPSSSISGRKNVKYTPTEETRNPNFKYPYQKEVREYTTDGSGEKIIEGDDFFVTPAGKDVFTLSATALEGEKNVKKLEIGTERMVYIQLIKMKGLTNAGVDLSPAIGEYNKHGISFTQLPEKEMDYKEVLDGSQDSDTNAIMISTANDFIALNESIKKFYIPVEFVDKLANKGQIAISSDSTDTIIKIPIKDDAGNNETLWNSINSSEEWFVGCSVENGGISKDVPEDKCSIESSGNIQSVNVDLSSFKFPSSSTSTITLTVNIIAGAQNGISWRYDSGSHICVVIATRNRNGNQSMDLMNETVVHEIGHALGMVTDGSGKLPDITNHHYIGKGHQGDHCNHGLITPEQDPYGSAENSVADCVMYGANGATVPNITTKFCDTDDHCCAMAVRKLDLSDGFR